MNHKILRCMLYLPLLESDAVVASYLEKALSTCGHVLSLHSKPHKYLVVCAKCWAQKQRGCWTQAKQVAKLACNALESCAWNKKLPHCRLDDHNNCWASCQPPIARARSSFTEGRIILDCSRLPDKILIAAFSGLLCPWRGLISLDWMLP